MKSHTLNVLRVSLLCLVLAAAPLLLPDEVRATELPELTGVSIDSNGILTWDAFPDAGSYEYSIANGGGVRRADERSVDLKQACISFGCETKEYVVRLRAFDKYGQDKQPISKYYDINYSYTAKGTLDTPQNIHWTGSEKLAVAWDPVEHADYYVVILERAHSKGSSGGEGAIRKFILSASLDGFDMAHPSCDFTTLTSSNYNYPMSDPVPGEQYMVSVAARDENEGYSTSYNGYNSSGWTMLKPGAISAITGVTLDGDMLSWNAYPGAAGYRVLAGYGSVYTTSTSVNLKDTFDNQSASGGTYKIKIFAEQSADKENLSILTNAPDYTYSVSGTLEDPTGLAMDDDFYCRWNSVDNAGSYFVKLYRKSISEEDPIATATTSGTAYRFYSEPVMGETYFFKVQAINGKGRNNSGFSTSAEKTYPIYRSLSKTNPEHGYVSLMVGGESAPDVVEVGTKVDVEVQSYTGYGVSAIMVNGTPIVGTSFEMPNENVEVTVTLVPLTALTSVSCTLSDPAGGQAPVSGEILDATGYTVSVESCIDISTSAPPTTFVAGRLYYYGLRFEAKAGYYFPEDVSVSVNGEAVTVNGYGEDFYATYSVYAATDPDATAISYAACTFARPLAGANVADYTSGLVLTPLEASKYEVYLDKVETVDSAFGMSYYYRCRIDFVAKEDYTFANDAVFMANGAAAESYSHFTATHDNYPQYEGKEVWKRQLEFQVLGEDLTGSLVLDDPGVYGGTIVISLSDSNFSGLYQYSIVSDNTTDYTDGIVSEISGSSNLPEISLQEPDIGHSMTITVGSTEHPGTLVATTKVVEKQEGLEAPENLKGVEPSAPGASDGRITGADSSMEYSLSPSFAGAVHCESSTVEGLSAGTYYFRHRESSTRKAGPAATVLVPAGRELVSAVDVIMPVPTHGNPTAYYFPEVADPSKYEVQIAEWGEGNYSDRPASFTGGNSYYYRVKVVPKSGYRLSSETVLSINGEAESTNFIPSGTPYEEYVFTYFSISSPYYAEIDNVAFDPIGYNYGSVDAKSITVRNPSGTAFWVDVELAGAGKDDFVLDGGSFYIGSGETNSSDCTVKPKYDLPTGSYSATLNLKQGETILDTATVTFEVTSESFAAYATAATVDETTTVTVYGGKILTTWGYIYLAEYDAVTKQFLWVQGIHLSDSVAPSYSFTTKNASAELKCFLLDEEREPLCTALIPAAL